MFINKELKYSIVIIFFISLCLFSSKWFFSFYYFGDEDLVLKVINESETDGYYYYPLVKYMTDGLASQSFDSSIYKLKEVPIPIGGLLFHSILYKATSSFGVTIILLEFLFLFLFLLIIYLLLREITNNYSALFLSVIFFSIPIFIEISGFDKYNYISLFKTNLFSFRFPRPLVINVFFIYIIYFLTKYDVNFLYQKKILLTVSIFMGLMLSAFYYYFFILLILIFLIILLDIKEVTKNIRKIKFLYLIPSFLLITVFLAQLQRHEPDFLLRLGTIMLDTKTKQELIKIYFNKLTELNFLLIVLANLALYIFIKFKELNNKFIKIFYFLSISTILAPFFFIFISNKINLIYHFNNAIVIYNILFFIIASFQILKNKIKFSINKNIITFYIFLLIAAFIHKYSNINKNNFIERKDLNQVVNYLSVNKINNIKNSFLTYDTKIMVWLILNNYTEIKLLNGLFSSKTDEMIENDIISMFKLLNLNSKDFKDYLQNEKKGWRYLNLNLQKFFFQKYQANSFKTFNKSEDFDMRTLNYIKNTSPFLAQQIAIPNFEMKRLIIKFNNFSYDVKKNPDIFIFNKNDKYLNINESFLLNYYNLFENNSFIIFAKIKK